jgi:hypothetical protein
MNVPIAAIFAVDGQKIILLYRFCVIMIVDIFRQFQDPSIIAYYGIDNP